MTRNANVNKNKLGKATHLTGAALVVGCGRNGRRRLHVSACGRREERHPPGRRHVSQASFKMPCLVLGKPGWIGLQRSSSLMPAPAIIVLEGLCCVNAGAASMGQTARSSVRFARREVRGVVVGGGEC